MANQLRVNLYWRNTDGSGSAEITIPNLQTGRSAPSSVQTDIQFATKARDVVATRYGLCLSSNGLGAYALAADQVITVETLTDFLHLVADKPAVRRGERMLNYRRNSTDVYIAHVHTHPTKANDPVYGCPPQATGPQRTRLARGPWDTSRRTAAKDPDINTGGGSKWGDWILVFNNRDEYVINADGEVWHLPKHLWFSDQRTNREFWNYTGNANAACNW